MPDKRETYRVEGMNAELLHYLKRLVRKTRCFSRCWYALYRSIKLFVLLGTPDNFIANASQSIQHTLLISFIREFHHSHDELI